MDVRPRYRPTEFGALPVDWALSELAEMDPFVTSGSRGWAKYYSDQGSAFLRITNLSRQTIYPDLSDLKYVRIPPNATEGSRTQLFEGDLLVSITADIGIIGYVDRSIPSPTYINQHIALVRFNPGLINSKFLCYFLASKGPQRLFRATTDQGAKAGMSLAGVRRIKAVLPPLTEQNSIAEALSEVDALIKCLEQLITKKRQLKQGAMQELLTGKKRLPGFGGEWVARELRDICVKIQDGTHFSPRLGGTDFLYVTSKNIGNGSLDLSSAETISAAEHAKIYARCDVGKGDLLLTKDGANTGNAAINTLDSPFSLLSSVAMLRFDKRRHVAAYFMYQILSSEGQRQIRELMSGNAITRLTLQKIRLLRFPVIPAEEQTAITTVLSDLDSEIAALQEKLGKAQQIKQGMMQELLTGKIRLV